MLYRIKLFCLALFLPALAFGQESTIRDLTDLTGSPNATMAFEVETSGNASGFLTLSSTESIFEGFLDLQDLQGAVTDAQVPNDITLTFGDTDSNYTATTLGAAIEELFDVINSGNPNASTGKVDWSQLVNVPSGFADGTDDGGGSVGADSIGTSELDDSANSPSAGDFVVVAAGAADFEYDSPNAGTDITADLEEETHASEHAENAADELLVENLGTACGSGETTVSDGSGGLDCGALASTLEKNFSFYHSSDLTTYDAVAKIQFANAVTITEIACATDTGTASINAEERAETTPNTAGTDAISSDLVCDSDQQATTTFSNAGIDADDWLTVTVSAVASSPTILNITVKYTLQ